MRSILIHDLDDVRTAMTAASGHPGPLHSAPGAALYLGAGWWRALQDAADRAFPQHRPALVLDCAAAAGRALETLRAGVRHLALDRDALAPAAWAEVAAQAAAVGATLHRPLPFGAGLDLRGRRDPVAACRDWLDGAA